MGYLLKIFFFILIVYYLYKFIMFALAAIGFSRQHSSGNHYNTNGFNSWNKKSEEKAYKKQKGKMTIYDKRAQNQEKRISKEEGDYVDYEELN